MATALAGAGDAVVGGLDRHAHPLATTDPDAAGDRDLAPFGRMVGYADVVGVGEATHGSTEFVATKQRLLRHLAEHEGFRAFAQEVSWSTGLLLDDYVVHGTGDPRAIMSRELQYVHRFFNSQELLDLIEWIRDHNERHAEKLRFVGADLAFAGPVVFDRVVAYAAGVDPALAARLTELYAGLRPDPDVGLLEYSTAMRALPLAEREDRRDRAIAAYDLVAAVPDDGDEPAWAVQHARSIVQHTTAFAFDLETPEGFAAQSRYRDEVLAENVVWWQRQTGDRILVSAQNGHVGYETNDAVFIPRPMGAHLRDRLGDAYVSTGFTFDSGTFHAFEADSFFDPSGPVAGTFAVEPGAPGSNEDVLDRVRFDDYLVDLRRVTGPARRWLAEPRPTHNAGLLWPEEPEQVALGRTYDLLIHLDEVHRSRLLP